MSASTQNWYHQNVEVVLMSEIAPESVVFLLYLVICLVFGRIDNISLIARQYLSQIEPKLKKNMAAFRISHNLLLLDAATRRSVFLKTTDINVALWHKTMQERESNISSRKGSESLLMPNSGQRNNTVCHSLDSYIHRG